VALRYGADLTARQIAELLGLRRNAVEVALHRALRRLRRELQRDGGPDLRPRPVSVEAPPRV
jgi:DNA-directed RNA polymerase specialized sigma24 family protein